MNHVKRINEMLGTDLKSFMNDFFSNAYILFDKEGNQAEWFETEKEAVDEFEANRGKYSRIYCKNDDRYNEKAKPARTICIDFDGVLHDYRNGWQGEDVFGDPVPGASLATKGLKLNDWCIILYTCRKNTEALRKWLADNGIEYDFINENPWQPENADSRKPIADVYLDDCALKFEGDWDKTLGQIEKFETWYGKNTK
jgi:hypothetical protein